MKLLPNNILNKMNPADRKAIGQQTTDEAEEAYNARIERYEDKIFANYLRLKEFLFLRANPARKSTIKPGWPDYTIFHAGHVLFIELKSPGKNLRPDQDEVCKQLTLEGFPVHVCHSAKDAINEVNRWANVRDAITGMMEWEKCEECGNRCPCGDGLCGACVNINNETENEVNESIS